jgi:hypothetical protein
MPLSLVRRAGGDTLGKLESTARIRFREAEQRHAQGEALGAIYLYGYSVQTRLKSAYYRTIRLAPGSPIDPHRRLAERAIEALGPARLPRHPAPARGPSAGHHVIGWAILLEDTHKQPGRVPLDAAFAKRVHAHASTVFKCWAEFFRYRTNTPYNMELQATRDAARWFRAHAARLWR